MFPYVGEGTVHSCVCGVYVCVGGVWRQHKIYFSLWLVFNIFNKHSSKRPGLLGSKPGLTSLAQMDRINPCGIVFRACWGWLDSNSGFITFSLCNSDDLQILVKVISSL